MSNSMMDVKKFLSTPEKPILSSEFAEFWRDLSEEEREAYKNSVPKE